MVLLEWDPDIVEVVQFGSSVYAAESARDLDLLIFTRSKKDYGVYLDATADIYDKLNISFNIDVIPFEVGERLKEGFAVQVRGAYKVLHGNGRHLMGATGPAVKKLAEKLQGDPTFEEARTDIYGVEGAANVFKRCREAKGETEKDGCVRLAFNRLFDAARVASMAYLATEDARWGRLKRLLPSPYREKFGEFVRALHISYFYNGDYPRERLEEEFEKWLKEVENYILGLEAESMSHPH